MSPTEWQNEEHEKELAREQQKREEIDGIYACLEPIRSTASAELVQALRGPVQKRKPSQQQSSKRRRASSESADEGTKNQTKRLKSSLKPTSNPVRKQKRTSNKSANEVTKRAKRLKSNLDYLSVIGDLKTWEHLSDDDFFTRRFQLWEILDVENDRRQQRGPDGSYDEKQRNGKCKINGYPVRYSLQRFTDWQFHFFYMVWIEEHRRIVKLRMARNRQRDSTNAKV